LTVVWTILLVIVLAGCGSAQGGNEPSVATPSGEGEALGASPTSSAPTLTVAQPSATPPPAATPTMQPTAMEDLRLPPEEWQKWPVIPTLSQAMGEVYVKGLAMGNNPHAFSKVGDCQNIPSFFLGFLDDPTRYSLKGEDASQQETIDNFAGSFSRYGYSLKGGYNLPAVFSPLRADPDHCFAGETPLECEYRDNRPSFVFIAMETNYHGRTAESYEAYLRQAVEFFIAHGTVPILATKADNTETDHSINYAIARVAYDYDAPLWNFWLSVQPLPDHGIDWARDPDGFHITYIAMTKRSYSALEVLDALWRQAVAYAEDQ
jgi:hypothetical protein